jgi:hypothetical protein
MTTRFELDKLLDIGLERVSIDLRGCDVHGPANGCFELRSFGYERVERPERGDSDRHNAPPTAGWESPRAG